MSHLRKMWTRLGAIVTAVMLTGASMAMPVFAEESGLDAGNAQSISVEDQNEMAASIEQTSYDFYNGLGMVSGYNDNGDILAISPAVMGQHNGYSNIFASLSGLNVEGITHFKVYTSKGELKDIRYVQHSKDNDLVQFVLEDGETMDESFPEIASAYNGSHIRIQFMNVDKENAIYTAELSEAVVNSYIANGDFAYYNIEEVPSGFDGLLPAQAVDENGNLVAVIDGNGKLWAIYLDAENFENGRAEQPATEKPETVKSETEKSETEKAPATTSEPANGGKKTSKLRTAKMILNVLRIFVSLGIIVCAAIMLKNRKKNGNPPQPPKQGAGAPPKQGEIVMEDVAQTAPKAVTVDEELSATKPVMPETAPVEDVGATMPVMPETTMVEDVGVTAPVIIKVKKVIKATDGPLKDQEYTITDGETMIIGRDTTAEVVFPATTQGVSRRHCRLYISDGKLMIEDMGSTYGTFIAGVGKINAKEGVELKENEIFYLGQEENGFEVQ